MPSNPYYVNPNANVWSNSMSKITAALDTRRAKDEEEKAKQKAEARYQKFLEDYDEAMDGGNARGMNRLGIKYPEFAAVSKGALGILESENDQRKIGREKEFGNRLFDYINEDDPMAQKEMLINNIESLESQGRDATHHKRLLAAHDEDPTKGQKLAEWQWGSIVGDKEFDRYQKTFNQGGSNDHGKVQRSNPVGGGAMQLVFEDGTVGFREPGGESITDPVEVRKEMAKAIQAGIDETSAKAGGRTRSKNEENLLKDEYETAMLQASSLPSLRHTRQMMEGMKTGGVSGLAIKMRQKYGGQSADEGLVSYNMLMDAVKQIRPAFGGNPSANESEVMIRAAANTGASMESNMALYDELIAAAENRMNMMRDIAEARGDTTVAAMFAGYDDMSLDPETVARKREERKLRKQGGQQPMNVTTQAEFDALPSGAFYLEDGKQYRKP